jgi:hypothetical protein
MPAVEDLDTYGAPEACSMSSSCNRRPFAGGVGAWDAISPLGRISIDFA